MNVSSLTSTFTSLPFSQLRKNRYFYLWYDGSYLVVLLGLLGLMHTTHFQPLAPTWKPYLWAVLPFAAYFLVLCNVFIHNCTHNNFPKAVNRLIGELCGLVVITRFASWEVIHQRHHRYSDDPERDPHPVQNGFWAFTLHTIKNVEVQLQTIFVELYGDTPENRRYEKLRAYVSYGTNIVLLLTWYRFLGTAGFFLVFLPAGIVGFLHLIHFNWSTHNAESKSQDFKPVNLNHGFFKIGNLIFFGIYFHANHHKITKVFNPAKMKNGLPVTVPDT